MFFFFFKQNTAYEMRISDWSSDVCSSDLPPAWRGVRLGVRERWSRAESARRGPVYLQRHRPDPECGDRGIRFGVCPGNLRTAPSRQGSSQTRDRKSVVKGKSVSVRVDLGGSRIIKKKTK